MSALERALERGREAAASARTKTDVEPVRVRWRGGLQAVVRVGSDAEPEIVHYVSGGWYYYALGSEPDGKGGRTIRVDPVRDPAVKRVAKAMLDPDDEELYELIREAFAEFRERAAAADVTGGRVKRGRAD